MQPADSPGWPKLNQLFYLLLFVGVALRCVALTQPLLDAHNIRQCQTAAATESLIERPGFHLSSRIPWAGDFNVYYLQELPLYNYLVEGVYAGVSNLDISGKIVTIFLWVVSFVLLQFIWRRFLNESQSRWANLLFVFAPLSVFFGQAFMPEMLVQSFAFAFVLAAIRYDERSTISRWSLCAFLGLIGLFIKLPEFAHLYILLLVLLLMREGLSALWRPRYLVAAALTIVALKLWSNYIDQVNAGSFAFGSAEENLRVFIGPFGSRFHLIPWVMIGAYITAFIFAGPAIFITGYGLWILLREQHQRILGNWLIALAIFYLLWFGNTAANQSYYNLPALAPLCALFGIGIQRLLSITPRLRPLLATGAVLLVLVPAVPIYRYLFQIDQSLLNAANLVKAETQSTDVILFRPNHSSAVIDYPWNATLAYYSKRPTFVWTRNTPKEYRAAALARAQYAVVTESQPIPTGLLGVINRFRHFNREAEPMDWLEASGFHVLKQDSDCILYGRNLR